jgi:hypothetical protein
MGLFPHSHITDGLLRHATKACGKGALELNCFAMLPLLRSLQGTLCKLSAVLTTSCEGPAALFASHLGGITWLRMCDAGSLREKIQIQVLTSNNK